MKRDPAIARAMALLAMLALLAAAYLFDRFSVKIQAEASQTFIVSAVWWTRMGLGMLTVLLSLLLALWVLSGSARNPLVHWVYLILGLLISFYSPIVISGNVFGMLVPSAGTLVLGDNVLSCARILAVTGLMGLLLKPPKPAETN